MSYRFAPNEAVEAGIKRMAREQVDKALTEIDTQQLSHHRRVHQVRKRCKKVRALARLVRPALGDQYAAINAHFRDLARPLSDLRDAHALVEAFDMVTAGTAAADAFTPARTALETHRDALATRLDAGALLADARQALLAGRTGIDSWHVKGHGFDAISGGLGKTYRRGRKAMAAAQVDPTAERYHQWRKRAKYLWYHLRILRPLWPEAMKAFRDEADRLASLLGDDHDLHVLRTSVAGDPTLASAPTMPILVDLVAGRSRRLRPEAHELGRRLFAEKPGRFVNRLANYDAAATPLT